MKNATSEKQIAANRRNAVKSTGPRTPQGRAVSKMNALKHGILSKQVLVRGLHHRESSEELEALHQRFWEELQPVGPVEEMLVDQIVTAHWRLRRALTAESGEIALNVDQGDRRRARGMDPVRQWMIWKAFGDPTHAMEQSPAGTVLLWGWLSELRRVVEAEGMLTDAALQKLSGHFHGKPIRLMCELESFREKLAADLAGWEEAALRKRQKTETLAFLDRKIAEYEIREQRLKEEEEAEAEARQAAAVLPSAETLEKILRYETKLERQMYRAMAQLERVQRMRRGESIPAPLSVELCGRIR